MSEYSIDRAIWQGRIDPEPDSTRWHQMIQPFTPAAQQGVVLVGFCCDEGVRRNHGRIGAASAPDIIRHALANMAWHGSRSVFDAGNIHCVDGTLEKAQKKLATRLANPLKQGNLPIVLGGGHEVAFASWSSLRRYLRTDVKNIGIINFDAHFDLRDPHFIHSSGTPFAQIAEQCQSLGWPFHYAVLGISRPSNTRALFAVAEKYRVWVVEDENIHVAHLPQLQAQLHTWMQDKDGIYVSFDIDVLPAWQAPGCSAPAALGVELNLLLPLLQQIKRSGKLLLADLAEVNPLFDRDNHTAKVAARIIECLAR